MNMPKLIVLRGPSGAGKSTIAKILFESAPRKTVILSQDYYRFIFNPSGGGSKSNGATIHKMILHNTLQSLSDGYDVILEGILNIKSYDDVFEEIFKKHPGENYIFYFDVSFEETMKRHATRPEKSDFGEVEMREWYSAASRSNHEFEYIIPENFSVKEIIEFIKKTSDIKKT